MCARARWQSKSTGGRLSSIATCRTDIGPGLSVDADAQSHAHVEATPAHRFLSIFRLDPCLFLDPLPGATISAIYLRLTDSCEAPTEDLKEIPLVHVERPESEFESKSAVNPCPALIFGLPLADPLRALAMALYATTEYLGLLMGAYGEFGDVMYSRSRLFCASIAGATSMAHGHQRWTHLMPVLLVNIGAGGRSRLRLSSCKSQFARLVSEGCARHRRYEPIRSLQTLPDVRASETHAFAGFWQQAEQALLVVRCSQCRRDSGRKHTFGARPSPEASLRAQQHAPTSEEFRVAQYLGNTETARVALSDLNLRQQAARRARRLA
ncbi:hypothetical protein BD626DRAFT_534034 [Schizophyllum amplum]|uniref:Uncharacterized protein n=1 Tax=Schizophyllum amplum TaxID=97359 RepID=A0A550CSA9_9AGAR|nr:hypothetical protein BD626DRAFT_534034 [Auriculariopsis ampla]